MRRERSRHTGGRGGGRRQEAGGRKGEGSGSWGCCRAGGPRTERVRRRKRRCGQPSSAPLPSIGLSAWLVPGVGVPRGNRWAQGGGAPRAGERGRSTGCRSAESHPIPGSEGMGVPSVIGVMVTLLRQHASVIQVAATVTGPRR